MTYDEFCELFNTFCVVYDVKRKGYNGVRFEDKFHQANTSGLDEKCDFGVNPHYLMRINRKDSAAGRVLVNLQIEDSRLERDQRVAAFLKTQIIHLSIYRVSDTGKRVKTLSVAASKYACSERGSSVTIGAELENIDSDRQRLDYLENGEYLVIPTLKNKLLKSEQIKYFLNFYTDLLPEEFEVTYLDDEKNKGMSPWESLEPAHILNNPDAGQLHALVSKTAIHTQPKLHLNALEQAGFVRAATLGSLKMDEIEEVIQSVQILLQET